MELKKFGLPKSIYHLFTLFLLVAGQLAAQSPLPPCTPEKGPDFEAGPPKTLCGRYSVPSEPQPASFQIGSPGRQLASQVIAILSANQLSGNVKVVGDFTIDAPFSFVNAVMFISPNVKITVQTNQSLTLNGAKLFCCNAMWEGIVVDGTATIETSNNTEIEDARTAIDALCLSTILRINATTFNRNYIGIRIRRQNLCVLLATFPFSEFAGNTFSCTQALNDPTQPVGFAGIYTERVSLHISTDVSAPSMFRDIRYGIYSPQLSFPSNTIIVSRCNFLNILNDGIYQDNGVLTARFCNFTNCFANGIRQDITRDMTVFRCGFEFNAALTGTATTLHNGINATRFQAGSLVSISGCNFTLSNPIASGISRGIYLNGGISDVGAQSRITVSTNVFTISTGQCLGVFLEGDFTNLAVGQSSVFNNDFTLFNHHSLQPLYGIRMVGDFQNFFVQNNDFFGVLRTDHIVNNTGSIFLLGAGNSMENRVIDNNWHLPPTPATVAEFLTTNLFDGLQLYYQDFTQICNNDFQDVSNVASLLDLAHSEFSNNTFSHIAHGPSIQAGLLGVQEHAGNQWLFPVTTVQGQFIITDVAQIDGFHIRSLSNPAGSLFIVHTPQATQLFDALHPFHPFIINPDVDNEFFQELPGSPDECSFDGFVGGDVPEVDKWVADGNKVALQNLSPAEVWYQQRSLYRLLQENPNYVSAYGGFSAFMAQHKGGPVGKFYEMNALLAKSAAGSPSLIAAILTQQKTITDNVDALIHRMRC